LVIVFFHIPSADLEQEWRKKNMKNKIRNILSVLLCAAMIATVFSGALQASMNSPTILDANVILEPYVLGMKSKGRWMTAYIELPSGYNPEDIIVSTIKMNSAIQAEDHPVKIVDHDGNGISDLKVRFAKHEVEDILAPGSNPVKITGKLTTGEQFEGETTIVLHSSSSYTEIMGNTIQALASPPPDTQPPEAIIQWDPETMDIVVYGIDNVDEDVQVTSTIIHQQAHKSTIKYILTDDAKNTLEITLVHNDRDENREVEVLELIYNGGTPISPVNNFYKVGFKTDKKSGELEHVHQNIHVVKEFKINTHYKEKHDETKVEFNEEGKDKVKSDLNGFAIFNLITDNGALAYSLSLLFEGEFVDITRGTLYLKADDFNPIFEVPEIPGELTYSESQDYYMVQFILPTEMNWKSEIEAKGGVIYGYIPDKAFIVGMSDIVKSEVEKLPFVRWVGFFQPAYKLSQSILNYASGGGNNSDISLDISVFANVDTVDAQIVGLGGVVKKKYPLRLRCTIKDTKIKDLAFLPDISWIQKTPEYKLYNYNSSIIMNVPNIWMTTYGLRGTGQVVAVADTGLDTGNITNFDDDNDGSIDEDPIDGIDNDGDGLEDEDDQNHADFGNRIENIYAWWDDNAADVNSGHGTHVAGSVLGNGSESGGRYRGTAPEAQLVFQAMEHNTQGLYVPFDLKLLFQQAYDDPSNPRIHTNSWGHDAYGEYDYAAVDVDEFMWNNKDMVILFAVGNSGGDYGPDGTPRSGDEDGEVDMDSIGSPATAKNCISVGASENREPTFSYQNWGSSFNDWGELWPADFPEDPVESDHVSDYDFGLREGMAAFSSRGPCNDSRIKPDVIAPGSAIISTKSSQTPGTLWGPFGNPSYCYSGGTSMATPLTAGAVAIIRQYYTDVEAITPSGALLKATLINGATDMLGQYTTGGDGDGNGAAEPIPNEHEGWGKVDLTESIFPSSNRRMDYEDV
jgi:subtilisin family serine protease